MNAHPDLLRAVVLAAIVITPDHSKRQLVSKKQERREKAKAVSYTHLTLPTIYSV